jgi:DNA-binding GntR family transcriptional regulator
VKTEAPLRPLRAPRTSLTILVTDAIKEAIVDRRLVPGDRVTESSLAEQLQVSKTPVREALLRLQSMGLVEPDGGRGGRIVAPSAETIRSAYEVREALEAQAARLAAERASDGAAGVIRDLAESSYAAAVDGDVEGFRAWDRKFHFAIADAAGNARLGEQIRDAVTLTWILRRRDVPLADDSVECATQHQSVAAHVLAREGREASEAMSQHVRTVQRIVLAAFRQDSSPP